MKKKKKDVVVVLNIVAGLVLIALLMFCKKNNQGYKWMWESLILGNLEVMQNEDYNQLSFDEKHEIKEGYFFKYINEIKQKTPENAIILMPSKAVVEKVHAKYNKGNYKLNNLTDAKKLTYFLYPRLVVFPNNLNDENLKKKVTHVAIVDYNGYENVPFRVNNPQPFTVVALNGKTLK